MRRGVLVLSCGFQFFVTDLVLFVDASESGAFRGGRGYVKAPDRPLQHMAKCGGNYRDMGLNTELDKKVTPEHFPGHTYY